MLTQTLIVGLKTQTTEHPPRLGENMRLGEEVGLTCHAADPYVWVWA